MRLKYKPDIHVYSTSCGMGVVAVEVISRPDECDRWRMLNQLIADSRLARVIMKEEHADKLCLLGLYLDKNGVVSSYLAHAEKADEKAPEASEESAAQSSGKGKSCKGKCGVAGSVQPSKTASAKVASGSAPSGGPEVSGPGVDFENVRKPLCYIEETPDNEAVL